MLVRDIMSSPPITVSENTPIPDVARTMQERNIGAVIVTDASGRLAGIITESDFTGIGRAVPFSLDLAPVIFGVKAASMRELEEIYSRVRGMKARDLMGRDVVTVSEETPVGELIRLMLDKDLKHVPVVRGGSKKEPGTPVGMVARHDIVRLALRCVASS